MCVCARMHAECGVTFQQLACPGPFSECEESLQLCEGVCACFSTFSNFCYLNTAKSLLFLLCTFFSCNVGQTFESQFAYFAHHLQLHRSLSLSFSPSSKVELESLDFSLVIRLLDFHDGVFVAFYALTPNHGVALCSPTSP